MELFKVIGMLPKVEFITSFFQSLIIVSAMILGRTGIYRILPVYLKPGKTLLSSSSVNDNKKSEDGLAHFYSVKQVPTRLLKNFLLSIGTQSYSIMEQATQTVFVMYPDSKGSHEESLRVKESLSDIFPGLKLEEIGFEQVLGLPSVSRVMSETITIESQGVNRHSVEVFFKETIKKSLVSTIMNNYKKKLVTGVTVGSVSNKKGRLFVDSYVLFSATNKFEDIVIKGTELQEEIKRNNVVTETGSKVVVTALLAGFYDERQIGIIDDLKTILTGFLGSNLYSTPLIVMNCRTMDVEAIIPKNDHLRFNNATLRENFNQVRIVMVK
jgi:hypothetical protein